MALEIDPSSSSQNPPEHRGLLYILLSAFAFLSGWFLSKSRTPNEDSGETVTPQDYTREEYSHRQIEPAVVAQVVQAPIQGNQSNGRTDDTPRWKKIAEWSIAGATVGLLVINIFLWRTTQGTLREIKSQTKLLRQQLAGTYAATITHNIGPPTIIDSGTLRYAGIGINFINGGKIAAKNFSAEASMIRESVPEYKRYPSTCHN